jgi:protein disulfide-isomerase A1
VATAKRKLPSVCLRTLQSWPAFPSLAPKYDELGTLFAPFSSQVTIAKVDATANDVPDDISGFPTIKLYAAGKKGEPITYQGSRTVEDLAEFIKEHGSHGVDALAAASSDSSSDDAATTEMPEQTTTASETSEDASSAATITAEAVKSTAKPDDEGAENIHDEL